MEFLIILLVLSLGLLAAHFWLAGSEDLSRYDHPVEPEGGETIADAVEVPFPFTDTGATCDNIDDYDEVCPYADSNSPNGS